MELLTKNPQILSLLLASFLGAFLGVRREMAALESKKHRSFMGFRTMVLISLTGALSTFFPVMPWLPAVVFAGLLLFLGIAYANGSFNLHRIGITSEFSAIIMFWIGGMCGYGDYYVALILTVILGYLNAFKHDLHRFVETLNVPEWKGALQMMLVSGVLLPFLPREAVDPWGVFVPYNVWLLVIFISGIGFIGYFLIKYFGAKGGIPMTALLGATVSSTAVTTSIAAQSQKLKILNMFSCGLLVALGTMQIKVALLIWGLGRGIEGMKITMAIPLLMGLASFLMAGFFWWRSTHNKDEQATADKGIKSNLSQPFELKPALFFGFIFVLVLALITIGQRYLGDSGVYIAAILSAAVDIDAIVLTSLESAKLGDLSVETAQRAIAIAVIANTWIKLLYLCASRAFPLFRKVLVSVIISGMVGVAVMFLI